MRSFLLAVLALSIAGCGTVIDDLYRQAERYGVPTDSRRYDDVRRDVDDYVRDVDRAVDLDRQQADRISNLLEDRASRATTRGRYGVDAYPFPRRARASSEVERFWRDADRDIERILGRRQRDDYRRFVRRFASDDRYRSRDRDRDDDRDDDDDDWDDN
ncbi:hypothetical protein [Rubrivirga sp. IMCC43871]|uniref:hypothetical protein n=1 Tax=Rubrivirga sp. IMCC43871 TaxID=3391575 RepID=UPI0039903558